MAIAGERVDGATSYRRSVHRAVARWSIMVAVPGRAGVVDDTVSLGRWLTYFWNAVVRPGSPLLASCHRFVGKTTTKDLMASLLSAMGETVARFVQQ